MQQTSTFWVTADESFFAVPGSVQRDNGKRLLRTSSTLGTANITTPFIHTTASMGQNPHIFVRRGERRLHYDATNFVVRNAGHSAGFDDRGRLKVY